MFALVLKCPLFQRNTCLESHLWLLNGCYLFYSFAARINPNDCQIEVHKFPRDSWSQFAESASLLNSRKTTRSQLANDSALETAPANPAGSVNLEPEGSLPESLTQQQPPGPRPALLCKIKPPANLQRFPSKLILTRRHQSDFKPFMKLSINQ